MTPEEKLTSVYEERANLVILAAKLALQNGWKAGRGEDTNPMWDDEWRNVVYIESPDGVQVSWHFSPKDAHLVDLLPIFEGRWDGSFLGRELTYLKEMKI